jgi:tripeptide aminopeptidase
MLTEQEIIDLFVKLVSHDAPSLKERAVADDIRAYLEDLGFPVEEDDAAEKINGDTGNLFCRIPGTIPGPGILFCTHMDTVKPCFGKKIIIGDDRVIRSDGSTILGADDISGVAAVLTSIKWLRQTGTPHRDIELLFTVAEELHVLGSRNYDSSKIRAKTAYVLDANKAPGLAVVAAPGHISFDMVIHGRSAHAGINPEAGVSAIAVAAAGIARMKLGRVSPETTANIGLIDGGSVTNIVADRCHMTAECRSLNADRLREQADHMRGCMNAAATEYGALIEIQENVNYYPYSVVDDSLAIRQFESACAPLGIHPQKITLGGGTDLNVLTRGGIPGVVLSCGMQLMHSCQEHIPIDDLIMTTRLVENLMTGSVPESYRAAD